MGPEVVDESRPHTFLIRGELEMLQCTIPDPGGDDKRRKDGVYIEFRVANYIFQEYLCWRIVRYVTRWKVCGDLNYCQLARQNLR